MPSKLTRGLSLLILGLLVFVFAGCEQSPSLGKGKFFNMRKISLSTADKNYLLKSARSLLERKSVEVKSERHKVLFGSEPRAFFLTLVRKNENALCTFGTGEGIWEALEDAVKRMRRLAKGEDLATVLIRLDVVDESTDIRNYTVGTVFNDKGRTANGWIFDTEPPIALLPEEIIARNIFDHRGKFQVHRLKSVVKDRGIGTKASKAFENKATVDYCRFTRIGFMENPTDRSLLKLFNGRPATPDAAPDGLLDAAKNAGEYLKTIVDANGKFDYVYKPHMNRSSKSYNLLRHAGTTYAMTELYEVTGDPDLLAKIKLAHAFLLDRMEGPTEADIAKGARFKALVRKSTQEAKAGGSALAIIAFAKYTTVTGDRQYLPLMQNLARFILHQTEENGHLLAKYYKNPSAVPEKFESIYYPGECVLALTRLYQLDGNKDWINTADKLVGYMVNIRDKGMATKDLPHDHWLCIGMNELHPILKKDEYKQHVYRIGDAIFELMRKDGRPDWIGSFYSPPRSTPSATRNEGVIALYQLAQKSGDPSKRHYETSKTIMSFDLRMQFTPITAMFFKHPEKTMGAYPAGFTHPEIRIDYVQHNLSAMLGLWKIEVEKQGKNVDELLLGKKKHQTKTAA